MKRQSGKQSKDIYWVGIKESEIRSCADVFKGSITFVGESIGNNVSFSSRYKKIPNYNEDSLELDRFIINEIEKILTVNPDSRFMFYNPSYAYSLGRNIAEHTTCCNSTFLLNLLKNKMHCRLWASGFVPVLKFFSLTKSECTYSYLKTLFNACDSFVIQGCSGAGGHDTYVVDKTNIHDIKEKLSDSQIYIVSMHVKNSYSVNSHIVIGEQNIILPPSIQIVEQCGNRLLYKGADFIEYNNLPDIIKAKVFKYTELLSKHLRIIGYKGICGVDYIVDGNNVFFLEINPRFQSSSSILNLSLVENNLPTLQELTLSCFQNHELSFEPEKLQCLNVQYSNYIHSCDTNDNDSEYYLHNAFNSFEIEDVILDGYNENLICEHDSSIFNVILRTNIISVNENFRLNIHQNVKEYNRYVYSIDEKNDLLKLKISLMNRGVSLSYNASQIMQSYRKGAYSSIDIYIHNNFVINCPIGLKLVSMSPFTLDCESSHFVLKYCNEIICDVCIDADSKFAEKSTASHVKYGELSFLATDRLRIHHNPYCQFKREKCGCTFCDVSGYGNSFDFSDIKEVVDWHILNSRFRHILIGGASGDRTTEHERIYKLIKYIKSRTSKPIYLMCLPPKDITVIEKYFECGLDEIAFNIEAFDRKYALKHMPGKGDIPIEEYQSALLKAVSLWGEKGKVKSSLIYGIEPDDSFFEGVRWLSMHGIQPIVSIFRPLRNTVCSDYIPPDDIALAKVYDKITVITEDTPVSLGPDCVFCQNNTLSFTYQD